MKSNFSKNVFINCPFDENYAPLLEALIFTCVYLGFSPQLSSNRMETGENRLDKILGLMKSAKYSIHDLSRNRAELSGESMRMNMPFELGIDFGLRTSGDPKMAQKKFLIFEANKYDLKSSLSDIAGLDVFYHQNVLAGLVKSVRDFFHSEATIKASGAERILNEYDTFLGWFTENNISQGHSDLEALLRPTSERIAGMKQWLALGKPQKFFPLN